MTYSHENLTSELNKLMAERAECQQRIRDLEELNIALNDREKKGNIELERQEAYTDFNICIIYSYLLLKKISVSQAEGETEKTVRSNETR